MIMMQQVTTLPTADFSDFIIYVDESGDHSLTSIDRKFPVFALSFCIFKKDEYVDRVVPATQTLKFRYWGHDAVVLHGREIRISGGDFTFLRIDRLRRERFFADLNDLIADAPFAIIGAVIEKEGLIGRDESSRNPYNIALRYCMEKLLRYLLDRDQEGKQVHIVLERRGKKEDQDLEQEFRKICSTNSRSAHGEMNFAAIEFEPKFAKKAANSAGLQFADLTAWPMANHVLHPERWNRPFELIRKKLVGFENFHTLSSTTQGLRQARALTSTE